MNESFDSGPLLYKGSRMIDGKRLGMFVPAGNCRIGELARRLATAEGQKIVRLLGFDGVLIVRSVLKKPGAK